MVTQAIVRKPGADFASGITTADLGLPDYERMLGQHRAYIETLRRIGLEVIVLDPASGFPDAYFVEDVAVVTDEVAVVTRPGALSRQGEAELMEPVLARYRPLAHIRPPGTLDGGDVLIAGRHCFIGISQRTNREGAEQLGRILAGHGYAWTAVPVGAGLHLKSSVNLAGENSLLVTESFDDLDHFAGYDRFVLDPEETAAANVLWINGTLIIPAGFPRTMAKLSRPDATVIELEVGEAQKMDGGLTCMSLRL